MKAYFELGMEDSGQYVFQVKTENGNVLVRSETYNTKHSALDDIRLILHMCGGDSAPIFDFAMRSWSRVTRETE